MTEKTYTTNPFKAPETVKRMKSVLREAPIISTVADVVDIGKDVATGDYAGAAVKTGTALAGVTPIGRIASKGIKVVGEKAKDVLPLEIGINKSLSDGKFLKNYKSDTAKEMVEKSKFASAGTREADKLINAFVPKGTKVGIRLNLNSSIPDMPQGLNKLQTVHKGSYSGKALSYLPFATVKNVRFNVSQTGRTGIASKIKGIDTPEAKNKYNAMSVDGEYMPDKNLLDSGEDLIEIGFNPGVHHLFIDLTTGQAVKGAKEATIIGDRVFAKGVEYWKKSEAPLPLPTKTGVNIPSDVRYKFKKGGMTMEQQMNLFEEGGMKDDGLDRDPVSGNEIPPGSLAKEVRDDIPAQLSDGEYVVPADVVQYFGVKFFEDIRAEAKRGLAEMEATGRIGGEPVEVDMTMIAFGKADDKKKKKKAEGGMIGYSNGGVAEDVAEIEKARTFNPVDYATLGFTPVSPVAKTGQLQQNNITKTVTYYHGETGESRVVTFVNGIVTPPEDVMYTQPPWSTIKPSPTKVQEKKQDRDDSRDPEFISTLTLSNDSAFKGMNAEAIKDKNGNIMNMTKQGYGAVLTSANRLGLGVNEYYNLPMSTKVKLVGQELKSSFGGKVDEAKVDKIIANAAQSGPTFFDRLINFGKSLFGIEDTDTVTKPQRIVKDVEDDNDDNQNISGDLTIKSDDTDLQKASKTASKSVTPGASAKYVGRTDSSGKKLGDVGYKSALRERQEAKQNKAKGGLLQRPKRRNKK